VNLSSGLATVWIANSLESLLGSPEQEGGFARLAGICRNSRRKQKSSLLNSLKEGISPLGGPHRFSHFHRQGRTFVVAGKTVPLYSSLKKALYASTGEEGESPPDAHPYGRR
jgi:hypothetical protein